MPVSRAAKWLSLCVALVLPAPALAQSFAPYSDFQSMTPAQLQTLQVKITWLGFQTRSVVSRAFTSPTNTLNVSQFGPYERPGFSYANDDGLIDGFTATVQELDALLDSVATLPGVTDGGVDAAGLLSFALFNSAGGNRGFESILATPNATQLFGRMLGALAGNSTASRALRGMACAQEYLPATTPLEVTGAVGFRLSGLRLVRSNGEFVGTVQVTNMTGSALAGPLTLVVTNPENAQLTAEDGTTCRIQPSGQPFVLLSAGPLGPGAMVQRTLRFSNPDLDAITPGLRLFSGPGSR